MQHQMLMPTKQYVQQRQGCQLEHMLNLTRCYSGLTGGASRVTGPDDDAYPKLLMHDLEVCGCVHPAMTCP